MILCLSSIMKMEVWSSLIKYFSFFFFFFYSVFFGEDEEVGGLYFVIV